jgi:hypothetical protein
MELRLNLFYKGYESGSYKECQRGGRADVGNESSSRFFI